jgi:energy-coupling factor transporter ATP-binding protein EcfA2
MDNGQKILVEVKNLKTHFPIKAGVLSRTVGHVKAVDGVSFKIAAGKTLGLVGESGCGKTTVGRTMMRLISQTGIPQRSPDDVPGPLWFPESANDGDGYRGRVDDDPSCRFRKKTAGSRG